MSSIEWVNERSDTDVRSCQPVIVLAEDNDDARRVYGLILRHYGFEVAEAVDGEEAVRLTRSLRPSLVLMDIGLPALDGWEASRILKSDAQTACIPLIAFSARVDSASDLRESATFDGYILKPISPTDLVRRVQAYLALVGAQVETDDYEPRPLEFDAYEAPANGAPEATL